jgi:hypothetical protein
VSSAYTVAPDGSRFFWEARLEAPPEVGSDLNAISPQLAGVFAEVESFDLRVERVVAEAMVGPEIPYGWLSIRALPSREEEWRVQHVRPVKVPTCGGCGRLDLLGISHRRRSCKNFRLVHSVMQE